jgi:GNAT superfamily N-acetyltransferase
MEIGLSKFDSDHYGVRVGKLVGRASVEEVLAARDFDVVFVRLLAGDPMCADLERAGHRPVDTLVTSTLRKAPPPPSIQVETHPRLSDPADIAAVEAITTESMRTSHLHADPRLPLAKTHALYAHWARNDVTGRGDHTSIVRDEGGAVIGYLAAVATETTAAIDLVAVRAAAFGRGLGTALVARFANWAAARGGTATVGTQHDNPALRLYARCGFVPTSTHFTYHLWRDP